jgi:hypothetical protein
MPLYDAESTGRPLPPQPLKPPLRAAVKRGGDKRRSAGWDRAPRRAGSQGAAEGPPVVPAARRAVAIVGMHPHVGVEIEPLKVRLAGAAGHHGAAVSTAIQYSPLCGH